MALIVKVSYFFHVFATHVKIRLKVLLPSIFKINSPPWLVTLYVVTSCSRQLTVFLTTKIDLEGWLTVHLSITLV